MPTVVRRAPVLRQSVAPLAVAMTATKPGADAGEKRAVGDRDSGRHLDAGASTARTVGDIYAPFWDYAAKCLQDRLGADLSSYPIPDGYEPGERLPMLVRFYEKYSQDLHLYPTPTYRHSPNFAGYVSNGYLVMQPDIHFRTRTSHSDMLECVEAAVRKVIEMGYADPERIGISGHSYGGQGAAAKQVPLPLLNQEPTADSQ